MAGEPNAPPVVRAWRSPASCSRSSLRARRARRRAAGSGP